MALAQNPARVSLADLVKRNPGHAARLESAFFAKRDLKSDELLLMNLTPNRLALDTSERRDDWMPSSLGHGQASIYARIRAIRFDTRNNPRSPAWETANVRAGARYVIEWDESAKRVRILEVSR